MKELIHIRHKINARIKSIGDDPQAMYAKKMMRRCIKDIDAVIDAEKVTRKIFEEAWKPLRSTSEIKSEDESVEIKSSPRASAVIDAKKVTSEVAKCKTPLDRFNEGADEARIFSKPMWEKLKGAWCKPYDDKAESGIKKLKASLDDRGVNYVETVILNGQVSIAFTVDKGKSVSVWEFDSKGERI